MVETAASLARAERLASYCSPLAVSQSDLKRLERLATGRIASSATSLLRRRATPAPVSPGQVSRVGNLAEILYVLGVRSGVPDLVWSALTRNRAAVFDRAVARRMRPDLGAVVGYSSTSERTFQAARRVGVRTVLDYPIPPWQVVERLMAEEERLVPAYAPTLQGHYFERWRKRRMDAEVALADRVIMLSSYHRRTFESIGVEPERMFIAPLCVDLDLFTPAAEPPEGTFRVAFVGQITQRKGISYLVEGFRRAELEDAELTFIGRPIGPADPWIGQPRVRHVPPVPRFMLPEILRTAHVTALPSIIEGFGATTLEGMACGVPAIVSEHSLAHDVIEDGVEGWVLPIRDPDAIAERLRRLYDDRNLQREMGRAARAKAEQYPWGRYGEAMLEGVEPLLNPARPAPLAARAGREHTIMQ
jgi:glycosyltransferase involved in cell wall biosynthesis